MPDQTNPPPDAHAYCARWSLTLAIGWGLLTLWMLLYPFDFQSALQSRWMSELRIHRLNFVSNLMLFVPFAWAMGWTLGRRGWSVTTAMVLTVLAGALISLTGETLQTHLPQRHSSLVDFLCNLLGCTVGGLAGARWSGRWDRGMIRLRNAVESSPQAQRMTLAVLVLLIVKAAPFDVGLETRLLRLSWEQTLQAGWPWSQTIGYLTGHGEMAWPAMWEMAGSVAMMLVWAWVIWSICRSLRVRFQRQGDDGSPALPVLILGLPIAVLAEVMQWFICSRVMDATDLASAWVGVIAGAGLDILAGAVKGVKPKAWNLWEAERQEEGKEARRRQEGKEARRQEGMEAEQGRRDQSTGPRVAEVMGTVAIAVGIVLLAAVSLYLLGRSDQAPYNLRRLLSSDLRGLTAALALPVALAALGGLTAWAAERLMRAWRDPRFWAAWGLGLVLGAMVMIRLLPRVMVEKVVGSPVWLTGSWTSLETMARLVGLMLWPTACLLPGLMIWRNIRWPLPAGNQSVRELWGSWVAIGPVWITAILGILLGRTIVVTLAGTDNLTELLRGGGDPWDHRIWIAWPGEAYLTLMGLLLGANAGLLAKVMGQEFGRSILRWLAGSVVVTIGAAWMGLALFESGLATSLQKYDIEFSPLQFLLGPNRTDTLTSNELFWRWIGVWTFLVLLLGCGAAVMGTLARVWPRKNPSQLAGTEAGIAQADHSLNACQQERASAWVWLVLAILASLLVIYGSLVPMQPTGLSLSQAWERYVRIMIAGWTESRSDWATNVTLFGGLAFIWMTTVTLWTQRRSLRILLGLAIWLGIVVLAAGLEYGQLLVQGRSTSPSDLVAAALGATVGLLVYGLWGHRWQTLAGRWLQYGSGVGSLGRLVVNLYVIRYLAWSWLPMDLVMNVHQLQSRWSEGGMLLGLGGEAANSPGKAVWELGMRCLMGVPIGWWLKGQRWAPKGWGLLAVGLCGLGAIELSQVLIKSQTASLVEWLAAGVGLCAGLASYTRLGDWYEWSLSRKRVWYGMWMIIYGVVLGMMLTWPWDFSWEQLGAAGVMERLTALPMLVLQQASTSVAIDVLLRRTLMAMPWGVLLVLAVRASIRWRAATFVGGWAIMTMALMLIEWLRAMSPHRVADSTGLWLGSVGILLGAGVYAWYCPGAEVQGPKSKVVSHES